MWSENSGDLAPDRGVSANGVFPLLFTASIPLFNSWKRVSISALVSRTLVLMVTVAAAVSAPTAAAVACGHQVTLVGVMIVRLGIGAVGEEVADLALDDLTDWHWLDAGKIVQLHDHNEISLTYPVV